MPDIQLTAAELQFALALAEQLFSVLKGGKSDAEIAQMAQDQIDKNQKWMRDNGFFPPNG